VGINHPETCHQKKKRARDLRRARKAAFVQIAAEKVMENMEILQNRGAAKNKRGKAVGARPAEID